MKLENTDSEILCNIYEDKEKEEGIVAEIEDFKFFFYGKNLELKVLSSQDNNIELLWDIIPLLEKSKSST